MIALDQSTFTGGKIYDWKAEIFDITTIFLHFRKIKINAPKSPFLESGIFKNVTGGITLNVKGRKECG